MGAKMNDTSEVPLHERVLELINTKYKDDVILDISHKTDPLLVEFRTKIRGTFEDLVNDIRTGATCPDPRIMELGKLYWSLTGHRETPLSLDPRVDFPAFAVLQNGDVMLGVTMIPFNFMERVANDRHYNLAALVFIASQARDFYNGRISSPSPETTMNVRARASAYEATFLLSLKKQGIPLKNDKWQRDTLALYPLGLDTLAQGIQYASKPAP